LVDGVASEWFVTIGIERREERAAAPDHDHVGGREVAGFVGVELLGRDANAALP
jgi:hypothetical protein